MVFGNAPRSAHRKSALDRERVRQLIRRATETYQDRGGVQFHPENLSEDELALADQRVQALEKALIAARRRRSDLYDAAALALECERDRRMEA